MDIKKKINKIIRRVAKSAKDIKNVSRKELSSAFQTAIKDLPNGDVKEAIEAQFEKYLGDFERRVLQSKENGMFYHKLKPDEIWKPPKGMSNEEAEKIRTCMIAKKLKKGLDIKRDVSMLQSCQKDPRVLMKLSSSLIPLQSLKNVMDIYEGYCQNEMEKCLHSKDVPSIQRLADFTEEGLRWFSMKYRTIPGKMEKSLLTYADIMAALSSIYVDLKVVLSRDMEKKEITSAARMLCGLVSAVVPDSHKLDVVLQLAELTPDDQKFIWPYVKKSLKDFKISGDNKRFLKYNICMVKLSKLWPEGMEEFIQSAKKIPAPSDFITWISSCNPAVLESIPTDRKFTGTHVTRFMLEDLDENLIEQFLEALTDRKDESTETAEGEPMVADDAEAVDEELPDLEVIEEKTETSTTSAPQELFFIDKGKPKAEKDKLIDLDEEEEENEEKMECDDDSGLNSESPLVLSDSDEEDDPTIIVDDALEEIEEVLQNAMNKEVSGSEQEEEGEEDVIVMDDVKTANALKKGKSPRKGKKSGFGDFEMHLSSLSKQLRSKTEAMETDELNKTVTKDTESQEGLVTPQKTPLRSQRSSSKRTTSTSSQKSNEDDKRMGGDKKVEESRANDKSPRQASSSKEEKVQEVSKEEAEEISSDNDDAAESVVSDSCDSDEADFVSCPKIEESIQSACSKTGNETVCEFMSPTVEMIQSKVRKSSRRKLLKDDNPAAEDVDVYTFIMSPAKKSKASEEDSSNKEDETAQTTRRRLRRKTTSDLLPESKTKKDSTRKSLMSLENSNKKSDSKITEYFKTTPIRTHGKVLYRDESVEEKSGQLSDDQEISTNGDKKAEESESGSSINGGTRRSTRKNKPANVLSNLTKHTKNSPVKRTRSQSGSEGKESESTTRQNKDSRIVTKSGVQTLDNVEEVSPRRTRSNSESKSAQENKTIKDNADDAIYASNASEMDSSCDDMKKTGTSKLTPKKSPKSQKRVLRSRKATHSKRTQLSESLPVDSPRKSLRSRKT
ncbi:protein starmaker [Magallana gigas]|uniref:protein starmaker n=1 Tax=Magallana gigas TaxID=29159 RepID=UPI00333E8195